MPKLSNLKKAKKVSRRKKSRKPSRKRKSRKKSRSLTKNQKAYLKKLEKAIFKVILKKLLIYQ